jgi:hypothetical protein
MQIIDLMLKFFTFYGLYSYTVRRRPTYPQSTNQRIFDGIDHYGCHSLSSVSSTKLIERPLHLKEEVLFSIYYTHKKRRLSNSVDLRHPNVSPGSLNFLVKEVSIGTARLSARRCFPHTRRDRSARLRIRNRT